MLRLNGSMVGPSPLGEGARRADEGMPQRREGFRALYYDKKTCNCICSGLFIRDTFVFGELNATSLVC